MQAMYAVLACVYLSFLCQALRIYLKYILYISQKLKKKKKIRIFKHFQLCMQTLIMGGKWMKSVQPIACKKIATFA